MTDNEPAELRITLPALVISGIASGAALAFVMQWVLSTGPDLAWSSGDGAILEVSYVPPAQLFAVLAVGWGGFAALLTFLVGRHRTSVGGFVVAAIVGPWVFAVPLALVFMVEAVFAGPSLALGDNPTLFGVLWAALCAGVGTVVFFVVLSVTLRTRQVPSVAADSAGAAVAVNGAVSMRHAGSEPHRDRG